MGRINHLVVSSLLLFTPLFGEHALTSIFIFFGFFQLFPFFVIYPHHVLFANLIKALSHQSQLLLTKLLEALQLDELDVF
jgi:hypothetical protein